MYNTKNYNYNMIRRDTSGPEIQIRRYLLIKKSKNRIITYMKCFLLFYVFNLHSYN